MDLNQHSTAKLMQDNSISYEAFRRENNSLCLKLILSPLTPNCYIAPINIPEPTPHLHLFLLASELIPPYESLSSLYDSAYISKTAIMKHFSTKKRLTVLRCVNMLTNK